MSGKIESRLNELGIELPPVSTPAANYIPFVVTGSLVFLSGQIPVWGSEIRFKGKVGGDLSVDDGYQAARLCGLNLIAQAKVAAGGDLDRVFRVVKLSGFVNSGPDFADQPEVINGASDLMGEVFGENGKHARFAVSAGSLPRNVAVEIDAVFELA